MLVRLRLGTQAMKVVASQEEAELGVILNNPVIVHSLEWPTLPLPIT